MKVYDSIPANLRDWCLSQPLFFTATAPLHGKHVNVSPKGQTSSTLKIFDATHAAYLDVTGSGAETIAHCYENGRITIMFCSFDRIPRIMRFYCHGTVVEYDNPCFDSVLAKMGKARVDGARAVILLDIWKVTTSCGKSVPIIGQPQSLAEELVTDAGPGDGAAVQTKASEVLVDRLTLNHWANRMEADDKLQEYRAEKNSKSLDGLTGMKVARKAAGQWMLAEDVKVSASRLLVRQIESVAIGFLLGALLTALLLGRLDSRQRSFDVFQWI